MNIYKMCPTDWEVMLTKQVCRRDYKATERKFTKSKEQMCDREPNSQTMHKDLKEEVREDRTW